jgi:hypothetical protein
MRKKKHHDSNHDRSAEEFRERKLPTHQDDDDDAEFEHEIGGS